MSVTEEDLLSPHERPPEAPVEVAEGCTCPECGQVFPPGPGGRLQRGQHRKREHPDTWRRADTSPPRKTARRRNRPARPGSATPAPAGPRRPAAAKPPARKSTAPLLTSTISRLARVLGGVSLAGARSLQFSAPAAGPAIDAVIAGTRIDKPLQKVMAVSDKWEHLGAALSLPILVTMCDLNPMLGPVLEDEMRQALEIIMADAIPAMVERRRRQQRLARSLAELTDLDPEFAGLEDPVGAILAGFFARPDDGPAVEH